MTVHPFKRSITFLAIALFLSVGLLSGCGFVDDLKDVWDAGMSRTGPSTALTKDHLYRPSIQEMSRSEAKSNFRAAIVEYSNRVYAADSFGERGEYLGAKEANDGRSVMFLWSKVDRLRLIKTRTFKPIVISFNGNYNRITVAEDPKDGRVFVFLEETQLCVALTSLEIEPVFTGGYWSIEYDEYDSVECAEAPSYWLLDDLGFDYDSDAVMFFNSRGEADRMISLLVAAFPNVSVG